ncbi:hypothetical protein ACHAXN_007392 [Cyclotella atomus]
MGYDANIKYSKTEQRFRAVFFLALATLALSLFAIISLIEQPTHNVVNSSIEQNNVGAPDASHNVKKSQPAHATPLHNDEAAVSKRLANLDEAVRAMKQTDIMMETDKEALKLTKKLQQATREMIQLRYGDIEKDKRYRVRLDLEFQSTIPVLDFEEKGKDGSLLIELAPTNLLPCSVYNFLEIARTWKGGAFHRNANHVLQAKAHSEVKRSMPFQEYSDEYPHVKGTIGYAGRPSGPAFYISILDNSKNHGPGSQQKHNPYEADSIIGTIIEGMNDIVPRIHTMPFHEFNKDRMKWVLIRRMHVLVPGDGPGAKDGFVEFSKSPLEIDQR